MATATTKRISLYSVRKNAKTIAGTNIKGGEFSTDLYTHWKTLYRTRNGKYFVALEGGAAITDRIANWLSREEAIDWIATKAEDAITGYGYTREQAGLMIDGIDAGKGYRGAD